MHSLPPVQEKLEAIVMQNLGGGGGVSGVHFGLCEDRALGGMHFVHTTSSPGVFPLFYLLSTLKRMRK